MDGCYYLMLLLFVFLGLLLNTVAARCYNYEGPTENMERDRTKTGLCYECKTISSFDFVVAKCSYSHENCHNHYRDTIEFKEKAEKAGRSALNIQYNCCDGDYCNDGSDRLPLGCYNYVGIASNSTDDTCNGKVCVKTTAQGYVHQDCSRDCSDSKMKSSTEALMKKAKEDGVTIDDIDHWECCYGNRCNGVNGVNGKGKGKGKDGKVKQECNHFSGLSSQLSKRATTCEGGKKCLTVTNKKYIATSCTEECSDRDKHKLKSQLYALAKKENEKFPADQKNVTMLEADMVTDCCTGFLCNDGKKKASTTDDDDEENMDSSLTSQLPLTLSLFSLVYRMQ